MLRDPPEIASRPTGWEALLYMMSLEYQLKMNKNRKYMKRVSFCTSDKYVSLTLCFLWLFSHLIVMQSDALTLTYAA